MLVSKRLLQKTIAIPLLDHILSSLELQFSNASIVASSLLGIVPTVMCSTREVYLAPAISMYEKDLSNPELFPAEMRRWRKKYSVMPDDRDRRRQHKLLRAATRSFPKHVCSPQTCLYATSHVVRVRTKC